MAQNTYQVKPGDSLSKIASQLGVPMSSITGYSSGDPNKIKVGETLSYGGSAPMSSNQGAGDNEVIGAGPNAGMTVGELKKLESAPGFKQPAASPSANLGRPTGMTDKEYADYLRGSPFLINDSNSKTGYRAPTQKDFNQYQQTYRIPTLSKAESDAVLKKYGIAGLGNTDFTGLTASQAEAAAKKKKQEILGASTLQNNSSYFQVTQLNNIKKASDNLKTGLSSITNDPWKTADDKKLATIDLLEKTAGEYAGVFSDPETFVSTYQSDPSFQAVMKDYVAAGGTVGDVAAKIANPNARSSTGEQSVSEYLMGGKNAGANGNVFTDAADSYMATDRNATIENINRLARVPNQYLDLYYGTPEKLGVFQKIKADAETSIKNLKDAYTNSQQTTSDQFDFQVQKNTYEAQTQVADLEEKRLQAKNYLTGRLAQIGALTTTGEAPVALANLDAKYEASKNATLNALSRENNLLFSKKKEAVNKLQADLADKIESISSNLNKSEEQIAKDILTVRNSTADKIAAAVEKYNTQAASTYKTFLDVTNKSAKQYIQDFLKTVSGGMSASYLKQFNSAVAANTKPVKGTSGPKPFVSGKLSLSSADIASGEQKLEASRGQDGYVNPDVYKGMYDKWISNGGLLKDFLTKYPPKNYVNPANTQLPPVLRTGKASSTSSSGGRQL